MSSRKQTSEAASSRSNRCGSKEEVSGSDAGSSGDKLFEPSLDMMVNDFDDESTLELEEQMASTEAEDPNAELNSLQREGDMPIEELLALYNCVPPPLPTISGSSRRRSKTSQNSGVDKTQMPPPASVEMPTKPIAEEKEGAVEQPNDPKPVAEEENSITQVESKAKTDKPIDENDTKSDDQQIAVKSKTSDTSKPDLSAAAETEGERTKCSKDEDMAKTPDTKDAKLKTESKDISSEVKDEDQTEVENANQNKPSPVKSEEADSENEVDNESSAKKMSADEEVSAAAMEDDFDDDDDEEEEEESELRKLYPETYKTNEPRLLRANSQPNSDDEEEEDNDYSPEEDEFKKKIMVGSEYQAQIPEGLCRYDDALPYENEDKLVWDPSQLQECDIELYLQKANIPAIVGSPPSNPELSSNTNTHNIKLTNKQRMRSTSPPSTPPQLLLPNGNHLRDDEQSLYLLLQCGHNMEEALRRRRLNATLPSVVAISVAATASNQLSGNDTRMSLWSEEECRNFESGLRVYGKDFHAIQQSKVRTRSVSELVQFYYLWKKTERHDIFANKARLEKKKYNLHPGLTDYMDRFLEEQENNGGISINNTANNTTMGSTAMHSINGAEHGARDRSLSPVINCLLYTDCKRQRMSHETTSSASGTTTATSAAPESKNLSN